MSYNNPNIVNKTRLQAILDSIERASQYLAGVSEDDFLKNSEKIDAVCMRLNDIGENIYRLWKDDFFEGSPHNLPWKRMGGLRNLISHEYSNVNQKLIWAIATNDLVPLKDAIEWHLQQESSQP